MMKEVIKENKKYMNMLLKEIREKDKILKEKGLSGGVGV